MSRNIYTIIYLHLILVLAPNHAFSQTNQANQTQQPTQIVSFDFVKQTAISRKELGWGKMYMNSYQKTREINYLNLAAKHSFNAIKSYHLTQISLKQRTRFTYQTKKERLNACAYYETIYKTSKHLKEKYHLLPINPKYCTYSISK